MAMILFTPSCTPPASPPAAGGGSGTATPPAAPASASAAAPAAATATAAEKVTVAERADLDPRYQWRTADLYADDAAWQAAHAALKARFPEASLFVGKLGEAAVLEQALDTLFGISQQLQKLSSYANRVADQDTRVAARAALKGEIQATASEFGRQVAYVEPELLLLPAATFDGLIQDPRLARYRHYLEDVARKRPHTLSGPEEELLAQAELLGRAPENVYDILTGSDLKFGKMTDSAGREVDIGIPMYMRYRASADRSDREKIFDGFWMVYKDYQNTFATLLSSQLNADVFRSKARKYENSLQASLDSENIPSVVYTTMIEAVNQHLPLLHRYLALRKKLLGLDQLYYHDLYPSLLPAVELRYGYDEAVQEIAAAVAPLGPEYVQQLTAGMAPGSGWIDVYPSKGKRTGAYMSGEAYDVHPFVLLNYDGSYDDMSTLAHEMGHALHSHLTNTTQPFQYANYSTFIAEIASTFNEALLSRHVLGKTTDRQQRLYLLGETLESYRTVVFRQSMFAEFELFAHQLVEAGGSPTAEDFNRIYRSLLNKYYGHDQGVTVIQDRDQVEWAFIPHFYYNYYVYAYVTGFISANALAARVLEQGAPAVQAYLGMLRGGSSKYPLELLQGAGVDMTTVQPYQVALQQFAQALDEVERLTATP